MGHPLLETIVAIAIAGIFLAAEARLAALSNRHAALARRSFETAKSRLLGAASPLADCSETQVAGEILVECQSGGTHIARIVS